MPAIDKDRRRQTQHEDSRTFASDVRNQLRNRSSHGYTSMRFSLQTANCLPFVCCQRSYDKYIYINTYIPGSMASSHLTWVTGESRLEGRVQERTLARAHLFVILIVCSSDDFRRTGTAWCRKFSKWPLLRSRCSRKNSCSSAQLSSASF